MVLLEACKKSDATDNTSKTTPLTFTIPAGWPQPATNIFASNPLTEEGFQLGRKLFYDGKLSKDGNFPCASCHQQFAAFATFDHDFSHGFNNAFTTRNAPGLFNLAWMPLLHWDGGINHIEVQPLAPIAAPNEMAETIENVLAKLRTDSNYPNLFKAAYGSTEINSQKMLKALAQFMGTMVSSNSKYDKVQRGEATFTTAEQSGYTFFKSKCEACHKEPLFTDNSFRNNGLAVNSFLNDFGRKRITNLSSDSLKFKVPSLRNVELTFPYMHDGRLYSMRDVLDHYSTNLITTQPTLDPLLVSRIPMTTTDKNNMVAFLRTLTDTVFTKNPRFKQP
ncbi:MAG: cytochrome-c peroxidase [Chitinophagaceae bacterium]|nr:cytochrome-c peroxidase [Chitinophagaceae bacterium]